VQLRRVQAFSSAHEKIPHDDTQRFPPKAMKPARKACLEEAVKIWQDQPSLGMLETVNEVRVAIRGSREIVAKDLPGVEAIRKWLVEAIENGELRGPADDGRRNKAARVRR
jgi:hypothetical protein